ncbi:hypothetical protein SESI111939_04525 [Serratia silvae]
MMDFWVEEGDSLYFGHDLLWCCLYSQIVSNIDYKPSR